MLQRSSRAVRLIEPCLPSPAKAPPSGADWLHEIKHDGFRILARRDLKRVRLVTRNGEAIVIDEAGLATAICAGLTSTSNVWSRKREKLFKRKRDAATG